MTKSSAPLQRLIQLNDRIITTIGHCVSWAALILVLTTCLVVIMRYLFNIGSVALQESLLYMHSLIFLLGAAWTLQKDGHVRVDIFYRPLSAKGKAWVNALGTLLLLIPTCIFLFWISWQYVASSWSYFEGSRESGGIDGIFLLKTLLLAMPVLMILQGLANLLYNLLVISGRIQPESSDSEASL
jgi:TRAP-type mannitol/chloroaromatic compound transport system permease small subunit